MDHNVHIYGWESPIVIRIIKSSDEDVLNMTRTLQSDSLVLVFGDHGATRSGRHGGGTKEELESGMFAYTNKNFTFRALLHPERASEKVRQLLEIIGDAMNRTFLIRGEFPQIDIVPTMSAIYNIPIPYSNLGVIVPEMMHYNNCVAVGCVYELLMDHILNAVQVTNYLKAYISKNAELVPQMERMVGLMDSLKAGLLDILPRAKAQRDAEEEFVNGGAKIANPAEYKRVVDDMFNAMVRIRCELQTNSAVFKLQWNTINRPLMYGNLAIRVLTTLMLCGGILLVYMSSRNSRVVASLLANPATSAYVAVGCLLLFLAVVTHQSWVNVAVGGVCMIGLLGVVSVAKSVLRKEIVKQEHVGVSTVFAVFFLVVQAVAYTLHITSQRIP